MKNKLCLLIIVISFVLIVSGIGFILFGTKHENNVKNEVEENNKRPEDYMNIGAPDPDYYETKEDGTKVNISEKMISDHVNGDIVVQNMSINYNPATDAFANYSYVVKNNGKENYNSINVSIVFIFSDGSKLNSSAPTIESLSAGESINVDRRDFLSIVGAVDYEVVVEPSTN